MNQQRMCETELRPLMSKGESESSVIKYAVYRCFKERLDKYISGIFRYGIELTQQGVNRTDKCER